MLLKGDKLAKGNKIAGFVKARPPWKTCAGEVVVGLLLFALCSCMLWTSTQKGYGTDQQTYKCMDKCRSFLTVTELAGDEWGISLSLEAANHLGSSLPKREKIHFAISLH